MTETINIPLPEGIEDSDLGAEDIIEFSLSYILALMSLSAPWRSTPLDLTQDNFDALLRPLLTRLEAIRALHRAEVGELRRLLAEAKDAHAVTAEQSAEHQQKLRDALAGYEWVRKRLDEAQAEIARQREVENALRNHLARIAPPPASMDGDAG